jgi:hypothetical protein
MITAKRGAPGQGAPLGVHDLAGCEIIAENRPSTALRQPRKGGRRPKAKGNRLERQLVDLLQRAGIAAERVPLSGSAGGKYAGDLSIPVLGIDRCCECKARSKGFGQLYAWLDQRDLLIIRQDRREPLVVIPLKLAIEIAIAAEQTKKFAQANGGPERLIRGKTATVKRSIKCHEFTSN